MTTNKNMSVAVFPREWADKMAAAAREPVPSQDQLAWRFDYQSRQDSADLAFVARQLEFMRPGLYAVEYPELKAASLIPYNTDIAPGAQQFSITTVDLVGEVLVAADMAGDTPDTNIKVSQGSMNLFNIRGKYTYTLQEAEAAAFGKLPLVARQAMACRELMERKLDSVAFVGDKNTGMAGLLTLSGTETYSVPATGVGGSTLWDKKSSDDIILDLNAAPAKIYTDSLGVEIPTTTLLPFSAHQLIAGKRVGDGTSVTVLSFFLENNPFIKEVEQTYKSETDTTDANTNGTWTGRRAVTYRKDAQKLEMTVPQMFQQMAPQYVGYGITTYCYIRTGGVAAYKPKSVIYSDNI